MAAGSVPARFARAHMLRSALSHAPLVALRAASGAAWQLPKLYASHTRSRTSFAGGAADEVVVPAWWAGAAVAGTAAAWWFVATRPAFCEEVWPQVGVWRQDWRASESMGPFLHALGVPGFAVLIVDAIRVDLDISFDDNVLSVVDKTIFGRNVTSVAVDGTEKETAAKVGRKKFMLSAFEKDGWVGVQCRLFQRGEGWYTRQSWRVREDGVMEERMVVERPGEADVVVRRYFRNAGGKRNAACTISDSDTVATPSGGGNPLPCPQGRWYVAGTVGVAVLVVFTLLQAWPRNG
eukprot:NODE_13616_length_1156_cov_6.312925.p1 GENE.NODE_13616_length_1156_cov_6.312925~~NODE_13616_length_1156_cov_6.312925.p1  ORF type:complete len:331 (+),score=60.73 NODE_13616_length_1156_cov_6.312925:117-995(+)